ncbi:MAG: polysaccharide deacetylase family protein [Pseudomonadota bacterium]
MLRSLAKNILQMAIPGRAFVWRLSYAGVGITFDDGPHPDYTPLVLNALDALNIKATFFFIGEQALLYPELVREVLKRGHALGGHSMHHKELPLMTPKELLDDLRSTSDILSQAGDRRCMMFRPPRGRFNWRTLKIACGAGFKLVHWSVTYSDYRCEGVDALRVRLKMRPPRSGDIILLHDNNPFTIEFLADVVKAVRARGLTCAALGA